MDKSLLTTARWELINKPSDFSDYTRTAIRELLDKDIGYPYRDPDIKIQTPIAPLPRTDSRAKIALCLGHARSGDRGAVAFNGVYEEDFNLAVLQKTQEMLTEFGIDSEVIDYYEGSTYGQAMRWLAEYVKDRDFTMAVEGHFNSYNGKVEGYEYLHWHRSKRGIKVAENFLLMQNKFYPSKESRGLKPLRGIQHERGVLFCSLLHCPSIILEPFFGDSENDAQDYIRNPDRLSLMNAEAIKMSVGMFKKKEYV